MNLRYPIATRIDTELQLKSNYLASAGFIVPMRFVFTALLSFLSVVTWAQAAPVPQTTDVARGSISGPGFTLALPPEVEVDVTPTSDLNFGLNLSEATHGREWDRLPPRFIGFTTEWNSDADSVDEVIRRKTADIAALVPPELAGEGVVRLASTFAAKLGDLPAKRLVVEFKNRQRKQAIRQIVVAYRAREGASAVVYVATLTTTRDDFQADLNLFAKLLAGFKLTPFE